MTLNCLTLANIHVMRNLQVETLSVDKNGILYVYINSMGYYYNAKTDKYEKTTVNGDLE